MLFSISAKLVVVNSSNTFNDSSIELVRRIQPLPTYRECENALLPGQPMENRALYWSGFPNQDTTYRFFHAMEAYAKKNGLVHVEDLDIYSPKEFMEQSRYIDSSSGEFSREERAAWKAFIEDFCSVFSRRTKGKMYLLMPYNTAPPEYGMFWQLEWPILKREGLVTEIIWIDSTSLDTRYPPPPSEVTRLWWKKGDKNPATYPGQKRIAPKPQVRRKTSSTTSQTTSAKPRQGGFLAGFLNPKPKSQRPAQSTTNLQSDKAPATTSVTALPMSTTAS